MGRFSDLRGKGGRGGGTIQNVSVPFLVIWQLYAKTRYYYYSRRGHPWGPLNSGGRYFSKVTILCIRGLYMQFFFYFPLWPLVVSLLWWIEFLLSQLTKRSSNLAPPPYVRESRDRLQCAAAPVEVDVYKKLTAVGDPSKSMFLLKCGSSEVAIRGVTF